MTATREERLNAIDGAMLTPLVRSALRSATVEVDGWECRPIYGGFEMHAGVYRFAGSGRDQGTILPWSLILKVITPPVGHDDPADWNYLKRDALAYQSGLLEDLPGGLVAPQCFAMSEQVGNECWIWLEEVVDAIGPRWPLARYGLAARHLGQFNGAYLVGRPLPAWPWLSRRWLRVLVDQAAPAIAHLPSMLDRPLLHRLYPADVAVGILRLWAEREMFLDALDRLPLTFCHRDAFRRNLFARRTPDGRDQTVAIDWVFAGTGPVGEELGALVAASLGFREVAMTETQALQEIVCGSYLEGLNDAGWHGDPRMVRFGYAAAAALRYTIGATRNLCPILLDERQHAHLERLWGDPIEVFVDYWAAMFRFLLHLADEGRDLLEQLR